jgi:hypothetical protein
VAELETSRLRKWESLFRAAKESNVSDMARRRFWPRVICASRRANSHDGCAKGDIRAFPHCTNLGGNRDMIRLQIAAGLTTAGTAKARTLENTVQGGRKT